MNIDEGTRNILKRFLDDRQRRRLRLLLNRFLALKAAVAKALVNCFPAFLRMFLKSRIEVRKRLDYARAPVFIEVTSSMEAKVRARSCAKEPYTVEWIESFRPGEVLWDIGANIGAYSLVAAKCHQGKVKVFAFEPAFFNFSQLCRNIAMNDCGGIITPLNIAFAGKTSMACFNYRQWTVGGALHALGNTADSDGGEFQPVFRLDVLCFAIDDLISAMGLVPPDHIKIDVDGIEPEIVKGAARLLASRKVRSLLIEAGEADVGMVADLKKTGYELVWKKSLEGAQGTYYGIFKLSC